MIYDPMPSVHVYPYDMFMGTSHCTDDEHECWCEPRIAIVPPEHDFAKEKHATRVFYHTEIAHKGDWTIHAPDKEVSVAPKIYKLLRSIPEPPEGGWDQTELAEGVERLISDVLENGWQEAAPPKQPSPPPNWPFTKPTVLTEYELRKAGLFGKPGTYRCMKCLQYIQNCTCPENDDDDEQLPGSV